MRGGHSVETVVCQYCSSLIDTKNDNSLICVLKMGKIPYGSIPIGAEGTLDGIDYVVIGITEYEEVDEDGYYYWVEHLLYSYTHGYVWLCLENGHWTLLREVKDLPDFDRLSDSFFSGAYIDPKTPIYVGNKVFKVYENAFCRLIYVSGEMTWEAKVGETSMYIDAIDPPYLYSIEKRNNEIEFFYGEYIEHTKIAEAFRITTEKPVGIGANQPVKDNPTVRAFSIAGLTTAFLALVLYFMISTDGTELKFFSVPHTSFSSFVSEPINFDGNGYYSLTIRTPGLSNAWTYYEVALLDEDGESEYLNISKEISYYYGREGGESWSEGKKYGVLYFHVPDPGTYTLEIMAEGNRGESSTPDPKFALDSSITLKRNARRGYFLFRYMIFLFLLSTPYFIYKHSFDSRRWGQVIEYDDD